MVRRTNPDGRGNIFMFGENTNFHLTQTHTLGNIHCFILVIGPSLYFTPIISFPSLFIYNLFCPLALDFSFSHHCPHQRDKCVWDYSVLFPSSSSSSSWSSHSLTGLKNWGGAILYEIWHERRRSESPESETEMQRSFLNFSDNKIRSSSFCGWGCS